MIPTLDPPRLALILAAEAIGDLPAFSTPEEMARAALEVAWALVPPARGAEIREEIALIRELVERRYHYQDIAFLMGRPVTRIETICEANGIRSHARGPRNAHNQPRGLEGLGDVVRKSRA